MLLKNDNTISPSPAANRASSQVRLSLLYIKPPAVFSEGLIILQEVRLWLRPSKSAP
jgi:hypothetical protein